MKYDCDMPVLPRESKVQHYWLEVDAMTRPMEVRETEQAPYDSGIHEGND